MPTLSCLIPIYQDAKYLEESLESIYAQTFKDFDLLVCLDESESSALQLLEKHQKRDTRIKILTEKKLFGLPSALNRLMVASKTKFFAFQGASDLSDPTRFEKQLNRMKTSSLVTLGSSILLEGSLSERKNQVLSFPIHPKAFFMQLFSSRTHHACSYLSGMYSKEIVQKKIRFNETMPALYDFLFLGEIQKKCPLRSSNLSDILYTLRLYPDCFEERLANKKIRVDFGQMEYHLVGNLAHIYLRYIQDARLSSAVKPY